MAAFYPKHSWQDTKFDFLCRVAHGVAIPLDAGLAAAFTVCRSQKHLHNLILVDKYILNP